MFNNSPSLADIAAVTGRNNNDGFGNGDGWWILILLWALGGNYGYGNNSGNWGTQAEVQRGFDTQAIISKLDGINNGICSLGYDQLSQMNGINQNIMQTGFNLQNAINQLSAQNAQCCCDQKTGQMQIMNQMSSDTCSITQAINQAAQNIMQNDNNNYRQLHDEQVQIIMNQKDEKISELTALLSKADLKASQVGQTADIVSQVIAQLRQCPVGTYNVANPNCCNNGNLLSLTPQQLAQLFNNGCGNCGNLVA